MGVPSYLKDAILNFVSSHRVGKDLEQQRKRLVKDVLQSPEDSTAWLRFLTFEEGNTRQEAPSDASLAKLYSLVWKHIQHSEDFTDARWEIATRLGKHIWTGADGEKRGRIHFLLLRGCVQYMPYYREWALLEDMSGHKEKALEVIKQGLDYGVEPQRALQEVREQIERGICGPEEPANAKPLSPDKSITCNTANQSADAEERVKDKTADEVLIPDEHASSVELRSKHDDNATRPSTEGVLFANQGTSIEQRIFQTPETCCERLSQPPDSRTRYGPAQRLMASASTTPSRSSSTSLGKRKTREFEGSDENSPLSVNFTSPLKDLSSKPEPKVPRTVFDTGAYNQTDGDLEIHHHPRKQHGNGEKQEACNKKLSPIKEEALLTEHVSQKQGLSAKLSAGERVLQSIQQPEGNRSGTEHCGRRRVNRKESDKQQLPNTVETHDANFQRESTLDSNSRRQGESKKAKRKGREASCTSTHPGSKSSASRGLPVVSRGHPEEDGKFVRVRGKLYQKLKTLGRGGSSCVYQVTPADVEDCRETTTFALKRCTFGSWSKDVVDGYKQEIQFLNLLRRKPGIIQLIDSQIWEEPGIIYMVLEEGEIDLKDLLKRNRQIRQAMEYSSPDWCFIRCHWRAMLDAVRVLHDSKIIHSDLKPANFLMVKGCLKLIDFGIAKPMTSDSTGIIRETQIGTVSYMAPEALVCGQSNHSSKYGSMYQRISRPSDIWSLGVILYQMVYGKTPFDDFRDARKKMQAIVTEDYSIPFPPVDDADCLDVLKCCLTRNPSKRITTQELLRHPFVNPNQMVSDAAVLKALQEVCPELKDVARVSQDLFRALHHDNTGPRALRPCDHRDATLLETGISSGYPEETYEGAPLSTRNRH